MANRIIDTTSMAMAPQKQPSVRDHHREQDDGQPSP